MEAAVGYTFADPAEWPDARLQRRSAQLEASRQINHSDARAFLIARELLHIVFEASARQYAEASSGTA